VSLRLARGVAFACSPPVLLHTGWISARVDAQHHCLRHHAMPFINMRIAVPMNPTVDQHSAARPVMPIVMTRHTVRGGACTAVARNCCCRKQSTSRTQHCSSCTLIFGRVTQAVTSVDVSTAAAATPRGRRHTAAMASHVRSLQAFQAITPSSKSRRSSRCPVPCLVAVPSSCVRSGLCAAGAQPPRSAHGEALARPRPPREVSGA
jgi:hypothetical protein